MNGCSRRNQQPLNCRMSQARSESDLHSARVSLHIGASSEAAWENIVSPWFKKISARALQHQQPAAVVTASRSQAYFFRSRLLAEGKSLLAVKFLSAAQLRERLFRGRDLHVPPREHLRLLLGVTAERFESKSSDDETVLIAKSIARDPDGFLRAIVGVAAKFLADQNCERLGIAFSGPGALPRLVATFLQSAGIRHNDAIAHLAPSALDDDVWRAWLELQQTPRLKPLFRFLRA